MIQKYKLQNGIHKVTITQAYCGKASGYDISYKYVNLKFENDNGYCYTKVFLNQSSEVILDILFNRVGLDRTNDEVNNLIGKQLKIEPFDTLYNNKPKTFVRFFHENFEMNNIKNSSILKCIKQIGPDKNLKCERSEAIDDIERDIEWF